MFHSLYHRIDIAQTARRIWRRGDPELHYLKVLAGEGRRALDIGANRGVFAYWMSKAFSAVEAFEPNPNLARALKLAAFRGVSVHDVALSDTRGESELLIPAHRKGGLDTPSAHLQVAGDDCAAAAKFTVKLARLDDFAFGDVDFIKIDVEGFEEQVLSGGAETIAKWRPILLIELIDRLRPGCRARVEKRLGAIGYQSWFLDEGRWRPLGELGSGETTPSGRFVPNYLFVPAERRGAIELEGAQASR